MRNLIPVMLLILVACSHTLNNKYKITGKITGKTPASVYLQSYINNEMQTIDSADFVNGEFSFTGSVIIPERYYIKIGDIRPFPVFVENSEIKIDGNIDSLQQIIITGSDIQNQLYSYQKLGESFDDKMNEIYTTYKATEDIQLQNDLEKEYDSIYETKQVFIKEYIKENSNSVLAAYIIRTELIHSVELEELEELTNLLNPKLKESQYTKYLIDRINLLRTLQPGELAPEFSQINTSGNTVHLTDFKGKYLLIDFWASWCRPCRQANPTVVEMYKKYNEKGFCILGVSMDNDRAKWLKAIEDDGLVWEQVSTLEGWKNPVGKLYGVNSIPHAILIDTEGKIVKRGIHADELDEILSSVLN